MSRSLLAVSDATPLIALAKISLLNTLEQVFDSLVIPEGVYDEVVVAGHKRTGASELMAATWINVQSIADQSRVDYLLTQLDRGEAEAIVLAQELQADWLLVDERKARAIATNLRLKVIGTGGLLLLLKQRGLITDIRPLLNQLRLERFRLSEKVYRVLLEQADEA